MTEDISSDLPYDDDQEKNRGISNALLHQRVEYLIAQVQVWHNEQKIHNSEVEKRLRLLERQFDRNETRWAMIGGGTGVGILAAIAALVKAFLG